MNENVVICGICPFGCVATGEVLVDGRPSVGVVMVGLDERSVLHRCPDVTDDEARAALDTAAERYGWR